MKHLIKILFTAIVFSYATFAQTITKTASKNNVQIGEEFYYTIKVTGFDNLSVLDKIEDFFGPEIDYLGVDLSSMSLFLNPQFCGNVQDSFTGRLFTLDFINCSGNAIGNLRSFSFKIKVKLNANACNLSKYENQAFLLFTNRNKIESNVSSVNILKDDPLKLQKTFRNYNDQTKELTYDVRLSSAINNFNFLDFNSNPRFIDNFEIPSCFTIDSISNSNHKVVFIPDEDDLSTTNTVSSTITHVGNNLIFDLPLDTVFKNRTSILYQVIIKLNSCSCDTSFFELENTAIFEGKDICGTPVHKKALSRIPRSTCKPLSSTGGGEPSIPKPILDSIKVFKTVNLDRNDLNLTMKGCTGKYTITIENTSGRLTYSTFNLTDLLPQEVAINNGPIMVTGNATFRVNNNTVTVNSSASMNPNEIVTIEIPFEVVTPLENILIENCASITAEGFDGVDPFTITRNICSPAIATVPNTVAIHTTKSICNPPKRNCGSETIDSNLPGDEVEYALHFYNYGTVEAGSINVIDFLPANFTIQNITNDVQVFKKDSGRRENVCGDLSSFKNITDLVTKSYSSTTNKLDLKFDNRLKLDEFTCEGVANYIVKIKAKINNNAPNGTYENQFLVNYKDLSLSRHIRDVVASNIVSSTVNVDNLIISDKSVKSTKLNSLNCKDKTVTAMYKIVLANMGIMPVFVDIEDTLNIPSPISIMGSGIYDIKICSTFGTNNCTPITTSGIPTSSTPTSFNITGFKLSPCSIIVIEYKATFNTNLLSKGQKVAVCNNAKVSTYIPNTKNKGKTVFTSDSFLIDTYLKASSDKERLEAIDLIKTVKLNGGVLKNTDSKVFDRKFKANKNMAFDFGKETIDSKCITLTDCVDGVGSGCLTDASSSFDFQITGMNSNGEVSTMLTNTSGNKITQIEYVLTDIRRTATCEDEVIYTRNKPYIKSCFGCSENVMDKFSTTNTASLGQLNYQIPILPSGDYTEMNKVEFRGNPTLVYQDNRTFKLPVNVNCNGTFEFTITAIVHFENCSVCYVSDSFDYNASWRYVFPSYPRTSTQQPIPRR